MPLICTPGKGVGKNGHCSFGPEDDNLQPASYPRRDAPRVAMSRGQQYDPRWCEDEKWDYAAGPSGMTKDVNGWNDRDGYSQNGCYGDRRCEQSSKSSGFSYNHRMVAEHIYDITKVENQKGKGEGYVRHPHENGVSRTDHESWWEDSGFRSHGKGEIYHEDKEWSWKGKLELYHEDKGWTGKGKGFPVYRHEPVYCENGKSYDEGMDHILREKQLFVTDRGGQPSKYFHDRDNGAWANYKAGMKRPLPDMHRNGDYDSRSYGREEWDEETRWSSSSGAWERSSEEWERGSGDCHNSGLTRNEANAPHVKLGRDRRQNVTKTAAKPPIDTTDVDLLDREKILDRIADDCRIMAADILPEKLRYDRTFILAAAQRNGGILQYIPSKFKGDRDIVLASMKTNIVAMKYSSRELKADRSFIREAVQLSVFSLGHVSLTLRGDPEMVLAAIERDGNAMQYATAELKSNRDFVLVAVSKSAYVFRHVSDHIQGDRDFVLACVSLNGHTLKHASKILRADQEIVTNAVRQNGHALLHASAALRAEKEVVRVAVAQNGYALKHASDALKADRQLGLVALAQNGHALQHSPPALRADSEFVMAAICRNGNSLQHAASVLKADRDFVLAAVKKSAAALKHATCTLRNDPELVAIARAQEDEEEAEVPDVEDL